MKQIRCLLVICLLCLPLCAQGESRWEYFDLWDHADHIVELDAFFADGATDGDLSFLLDYPDLTRLYIQNAWAVTDLSPLATLTQLQDLRIQGGAYADLTPLQGLNALEYLWLEDAPLVRDASALSGLTNLTWLHLYKCPNIADFSFLNRLTHMMQLDLYDVPFLQDLSFAPRMQELISFTCSDAQVSDLMPLVQCPELAYVHCFSCQITDIAEFCRSDILLVEAFFRDNPIADVSPLLDLNQGVAMEVTLPNGSIAYGRDNVETYVNASPQEQATMFFEYPYGDPYEDFYEDPEAE